MQTIRIGDAVYEEAKLTAPLAKRITTVVNRVDPAVNNEVTQEVVSFWEETRTSGIEFIEYRDLPENHDIIDPDNAQARTELVYPRLIEALHLLEVL